MSHKANDNITDYLVDRLDEITSEHNEEFEDQITDEMMIDAEQLLEGWQEECTLRAIGVNPSIIL